MHAGRLCHSLYNTKSSIHSLLTKTSPPLFQRVPPWWARWTLGLVACDIFLTFVHLDIYIYIIYLTICPSGSAIELTWNHWSTLHASHLENAPVGSRNVSSPAQSWDNYTLRPSWQRLVLCIAHLGFGAGLATALLVAQTRFIRTFAILPPGNPTENRHVFIQCAHNFKNNGIAFPMSKCSLEEGRDNTEMIFRVAGKRGHWYIGLNGAVIHGRRLSIDKTRAAILADWGGKSVGRWTTPGDNRWKSGPMRRTG